MSVRFSTSRASSSQAAAPLRRSSWAAPPTGRIPGPLRDLAFLIASRGRAPLTLRPCPQFCCRSPWRTTLSGSPRPMRATCINTRLARRPCRPSIVTCFLRAGVWRGVAIGKFVSRMTSQRRTPMARTWTGSWTRSETPKPGDFSDERDDETMVGRELRDPLPWWLWVRERNSPHESSPRPSESGGRWYISSMSAAPGRIVVPKDRWRFPEDGAHQDPGRTYCVLSRGVRAGARRCGLVPQPVLRQIRVLDPSTRA